jgi:hypothetical protein
MDLCSIEATQIEGARTSSAKDKAARALILHAVKETKAMDILRRGVPLSLSPFLMLALCSAGGGCFF